jgi:hypothetical protein
MINKNECVWQGSVFSCYSGSWTNHFNIEKTDRQLIGEALKGDVDESLSGLDIDKGDYAIADMMHRFGPKEHNYKFNF